ncbi:hypothetical protein [Fredinandcohnia onubensis]|uniref:hypothetical protein n=1 Tax=Fredinandcohnia onubensis TaxID=1571209 RepID=UPI000C0BD7A3|nr:hypothetical protein [Fredinandcohnia onubensis]
MKIIGITLLMMVCLMSFSFWLDYLQGFELQTAFRNATSPFRVMDPAETIVFLTFILTVLIEIFVYSYKKRKAQAKTR